jgi:Protein of unknown function (DUF2568).
LSIILQVNLLVRFLLELCALASLGYWGFHTGAGPWAKFGLGIGAPLLAALVWGTFVSPRAAIPVHGIWHLLLETAVFGAAAAALYAAGHPSLSLAFILIAVTNRVLMYIWHQ